MKQAITNLHATVQPHSDRVGLGCNRGTVRYHVWVTRGRPTKIDGDALYANPAKHLRRGEPGYFGTRQLDATAAKNQPVVRAMLDEAPRLIAEADAREGEREKERLAKVAAERAASHAVDVEAAMKLIDAHLTGDRRFRLATCTVNRDALAEAIADEFARQRNRP